MGTVLAYCSAAFTALLGWWFLKESLTWVKGVAVLLCLGGCVLVAGALDPAAWSINLIGIITGIGSGLFYAIYTLMGRSASNRGLNPWTTLLYTFGFGAVWLLGIDLVGNGILPGTAQGLSGLLWPEAGWQGWLILFILAAIPTLAGFGLIQCQPQPDAVQCGQSDRNHRTGFHSFVGLFSAQRKVHGGAGYGECVDRDRCGLPAVVGEQKLNHEERKERFIHE